MNKNRFSGLIVLIALVVATPGYIWAKDKKKTPTKLSYTVTGTFTNMPPMTIVMEQLRANDSIRTVDSQQSDMAGHFVFKGTQPEPGLYRIRFTADKFLLLSIDKGDITISAAWPFTSFVLSGSAGSAELQTFVDSVVYLMNSLNRMNKLADSLKALGDATVRDVDNRRQELNQYFRNYIKNYANTTVYEPNAVIAARVLNPAEDAKFYETFSAALPVRFPGTIITKEFGEFMANMREMMPEPNEIGYKAPELSLKDTSGKVVKLSSFQGKYVLLDFWASWCGPCRAENPNVLAAYKKYHPKNFTILAVSLDTKKDAWIGAVHKDALLWPQVSDLKGWQSPAAAKYSVRGIPMNFLIDPNGIIIAKNLRGPDLEKKLEEVLK